jgi:hypothetical protein
MSGGPESRPYWSERQGRGPKAEGLKLDALKKLVFSVFDDLWARDYFQEAFGYTCVDDGAVEGTLGHDIPAWFLRTLHRDHMWPYGTWGAFWGEDSLFDMIEVMHDLCSRGVEGIYHDYSDCGWHYTSFDSDAGRAEYRAMMNQALERYERPLELDEEGRIVEAPPDEFRPLLEAEMPANTDADLITKRVDDAIELFRSRNATVADRRRAVRELADVLEPLRQTIKEEALPKDESEMFRLANGFAIRHNNREQKSQYDDIVWLRWAFYVYLATIHATVRLQARQHQATQ